VYTQSALVEIHEDNETGVHNLIERDRGFTLPKNKTIVRIGSQLGQFIQHWLAHRRFHDIRERTEARFKVIPHVGICDVLKQHRPIVIIGKQQADFEERQIVCR